MSLINQIKEFDSISLAELTNYSLMNRVDTKFFFSKEYLENILKSLHSDYRMLNTNKNRFVEYSSLYFDTDDNKMYLDHHNERINRYKIRFREYLDSNLTFLEVKLKNNKGRTQKKRIKVKKCSYKFNEKENEFISQHLPKNFGSINSVLWIYFKRLTMVHKKNKERLTIDFDLEVYNDNKKIKLNNLCIAELKQEKHSFKSDFFRVMKINKLRSNRISKYCIGMNLLNNKLKYNKFKHKLLTINKIQNGNIWQ